MSVRLKHWILCSLLIITTLFVFNGTGIFSFSHPYIPGGKQGDQLFYLWTIERSMNSPSYQDFVDNRQWSNQGVVHLDTVPQEWRSFYWIGKAGKFLHLTADETLVRWYDICVLLNLFSAYLFLFVVGGQAVMAACLSLAIGFQESLLARLGGHFSLASAWQGILVLTATFYLLRSIFLGNEGGACWRLLLLLTTFLCLLQTFYYSAFVAVLCGTFGIGFFFIFYERKALFPRISQALLRVGLPVVVAVLFGIPFLKYLVPGQSRHITFARTTEEVMLFSSRFTDFFNPPNGTYFRRALKALGMGPYVHPIGRYEVLGYWGSGILVSVFVFFFLLLSRRKCINFRETNQKIDVRPVLLLLIVVSMLLSLPVGGLVVHHFVPGLRCFARVAPFIVLSVSAFLLLCFKREKKWILVVCVISAAISAHEAKVHVRDDGREVASISEIQQEIKVARLIKQMKEICTLGELQVIPPVEDFMFGPYLLYYIAEKSHCRLNGIGPVNSNAVINFIPSIAGRVDWKDQSFEIISQRPPPTAPPPAEF